jgi:hypothetical protein
MVKTETFDQIDDPRYRIDEIGEARERIAGRFKHKMEVYKDLNKLRGELYLMEMDDATDRHLIRELNKSPYSSLKAYFRGEARHAPELRN